VKCKEKLFPTLAIRKEKIHIMLLMFFLYIVLFNAPDKIKLMFSFEAFQLVRIISISGTPFLWSDCTCLELYLPDSFLEIHFSFVALSPVTVPQQQEKTLRKKKTVMMLCRLVSLIYHNYFLEGKEAKMFRHWPLHCTENDYDIYLIATVEAA